MAHLHVAVSEYFGNVKFQFPRTISCAGATQICSTGIIKSHVGRGINYIRVYYREYLIVNVMQVIYSSSKVSLSFFKKEGKKKKAERKPTSDVITFRDTS